MPKGLPLRLGEALAASLMRYLSVFHRLPFPAHIAAGRQAGGFSSHIDRESPSTDTTRATYRVERGRAILRPLDYPLVFNE